MTSRQLRDIAEFFSSFSTISLNERVFACAGKLSDLLRGDEAQTFSRLATFGLRKGPTCVRMRLFVAPISVERQARGISG
jgi:hypothetical protein